MVTVEFSYYFLRKQLNEKNNMHKGADLGRLIGKSIIHRNVDLVRMKARYKALHENKRIKDLRSNEKGFANLKKITLRRFVHRV